MDYRDKTIRGVPIYNNEGAMTQAGKRAIEEEFFFQLKEFAKEQLNIEYGYKMEGGIRMDITPKTKFYENFKDFLIKFKQKYDLG